MHRPFVQRLAISLFLLILSCSSLGYANHEQLSSIASRNFWQLNDALAFYQNAARQPWVEIPDEPRLLYPGKKSSTVLLLRERLLATGDLQPINDRGYKKYDYLLKEAVINFQQRHGLKADGVVGDDTRAELNIPPEFRMKQIAVNMQRWANLAGKLGNRFILVNIPEFHMYLIENDQKVLDMRAIVGKKELPTPEISSKVTRIIFNPYWNIPPNIAKNDIAPKMLEDPGYMSRLHIRAFRRENDDNSQVSPSGINWESAADNGVIYHLRQDPGPDNALGQIKFEFANSHDVYMHDTPAKNLFDNHERDLSHGCIRLENPTALVSYLMKDDPNWSDFQLQEFLDSQRTKYIRITKPIPIFVTYITSWIDEEGRVNFRDDLYQLDDPQPNPGQSSDSNNLF